MCIHSGSDEDTFIGVLAGSKFAFNFLIWLSDWLTTARIHNDTLPLCRDMHLRFNIITLISMHQPAPSSVWSVVTSKFYSPPTASRRSHALSWRTITVKDLMSCLGCFWSNVPFWFEPASSNIKARFWPINTDYLFGSTTLEANSLRIHQNDTLQLTKSVGRCLLGVEFT